MLSNENKLSSILKCMAFYFINIILDQIKSIKSNLFIVTHHVHKCTDGEILRYKTLCHGSTSNKIFFKIVL